MNKSKFQTFIENLVLSALSILKIILLSKIRIKLPKAKTSECVILGNGPSLTDVLLNNSEFFNEKELFCLNHFEETKYYKELTPKNCIINAPELWLNNVEKSHIERI